ncbi:hypothetical protein BDV12DRAFT_198561 [Aspergillus spectabilis]
MSPSTPSPRSSNLDSDVSGAVRMLTDRILLGLTETSEGSVNVNPIFQRYVLANLSEVGLGSSSESKQKPNATPPHAFQLRIKPKIFPLIFLNFPFLDLLKLPTRQETECAPAQAATIVALG